jgi:hypothetical protein
MGDTLVSVSALVRAQAGMTMVLSLSGVVDDAGNADAVTDQHPSTEEWTRLTVRKRIVRPSPDNRISVGVTDADAGEWFEVRALDVILGVVP